MTALEDWSVGDKLEWDAATRFLETTLQQQLSDGKKMKMISCHKLNTHRFYIHNYG